MKKKVYKFIDNEKKYVPILSKEIIETFKAEANSENVEYSFTIDGQSREIKGDEANTYFVFDTAGETSLDSFKKSLFHKDLKNIKEDSHEEKKLMEDVRNFLFKICQRITFDYKEDIKKTIRKVVLDNKYSEKTVPLNKVEIVSIDVADYSSIPEAYKYLLRIGKVPKTEVNTDEIIKFVQNRQEKTGMDIGSIFNIEKQAGNPMFKNVISIEPTRKFLNEISLYFFIDYSVNISKEKEILEK